MTAIPSSNFSALQMNNLAASSAADPIAIENLSPALKDNYSQAISPERHIQRLEQDQKVLAQMVERADPRTSRADSKPNAAGASIASQNSETLTGTKSSTVIAGVSEEVVREIKKRFDQKVGSTSSGDMREVDSRKKEGADEDPKKRKKHQEFMFDLMALLVRMGLIKRTK